MSTSQNVSINCPECGIEISLDETLAGPTIAKIREEANEQVRKAKADAEEKVMSAREEAEKLAEKEKELAEREANISTQVSKAMAAERLLIQEEERKKLKEELAPELEAERTQVEKLKADLKESQAAELALRVKQDELKEREEALELEVARKVDAKRKEIEEKSGKDLEEKISLKLAEKDKVIDDMKKQLADAQRKAEQGSQQLQGEVLELDFQAKLQQFFPQDSIEPVKTGAYGGDIEQSVLGGLGTPVGKLLWEAKRTQNWGGDWTKKVKQDARDAKADIPVIVSEVLPAGVNGFGEYDGVWVTSPSNAVMLGAALRQGIIQVAQTRTSLSGRREKKERLYEYMVGPEFKAIVEGIAQPFQDMSQEIASEKRSTMARWKRQEQRLQTVLENVASLQGDLQGIAGMDAPILPGFEAEELGDEDGE